jgi:uncharacterized protein
VPDIRYFFLLLNMHYRKFGSLDWESSILAFGASRIPSAGMIRRAIDLGINYVDLGYPYDLHRQRRISEIVREALQDGYRAKVKVAVTLPSHLIGGTGQFDRQLDSQLQWLGEDRVDFCLFGRLNRETWPVLRNYAALAWAEAALESGRIAGAGFSFHDHFQILKAIMSGWDRWTLCQFQFSYMDVDHDPGLSGIRYASEKGLAVVVAEPLRRGRLAGAMPDQTAGLLAGALRQKSAVAWGLTYVWSCLGVSSAIGDFGSIDELEESAAIAGTAAPDGLTVPEEILIAEMRDAWRSRRQIPCASCRPCMPCPEGLDVPRIFEIYNDAFIYDDVETARAIYREELHPAARCTRCGICESRCVKKLRVVEVLAQALRLLDP